MPGVEDEYSVEEFSAEAANPTFYDRVCAGRPDRCLDDLDALAGEDRSGAVHRVTASHEADDSMTMSLTRRAALKAGAGGALAMLVCRPFAAFADDGVETHGLSSFGDLA